MNHDQQLQFKRDFGVMKNENLAKKYNISIEEVVDLGELYSLGKDKKLFRDIPTKLWTPEEIQQLRDLYPMLPNETVATSIGRTVSSVMSKAYYLGIKKDRDRLAVMGRENVRHRKDRK